MNQVTSTTDRREFAIKDAKPWRAVFSICLPTIILMLAQAIYNVIDKYLALAFASNDIMNNPAYQIALSQLGKGSKYDAAGELINLATQYAGNVFNFLVAFAVMFGVGASIVYSIKYGAKDKDGMHKTVGNGFVVSLVSSIVILVIALILILPNFNYIIFDLQSNVTNHQPELVHVLNKLSFDYAIFMCAFAPVLFLNYLIISLLRSEGRMIFITVVTLASLVGNVLFAYIFVDLLHMALRGAMLATVVAWFISIISCLVLIFTSKTTNIRFTKLGWKLDKKLIGQIWVLGFGALVSNLSTVIVSIIATNLTGNLPSGGGYNNDNGQLQQLYSALSPWMMLTLAPALGIFQGGAALLGYAYGANRYHRCKELTIRIMILELIWFVFIFIMFIVVGDQMLGLFKDTESNHHVLLILNFSTYPLAFVNYTVLTFLQSVGKGKECALATSIRAFIIPIPLVFIGHAVALATHNPIWFFALYGTLDAFAFVLVSIIMIVTTKNYRHHMVDIDLNNNPAAFQTFVELDLQAKIRHYTKRKLHLERLANQSNWFLIRHSAQYHQRIIQKLLATKQQQLVTATRDKENFIHRLQSI